jgi:hypothetical protein
MGSQGGWEGRKAGGKEVDRRNKGKLERKNEMKIIEQEK